MLNQRSHRTDGVRWSHLHPCLHEAAVQPNYWGLACHHTATAKSCLRVYVSRTALTPHARRLRSGNSLSVASTTTRKPRTN
jgi:hypothetical protein